jgi:membrane protein
MHLPAVWTTAVAGGRARTARAKSWFERVRADAERHFPVLTELTTRLLSANLLDAASRLAAQAFLTSVPLLFAVAAFAPEAVRDQLLSSLRSIFGLTGGADQQLQQALGTGSAAGAESDQLRQTSGVIGALMALLSATSFSRAVARVCERAWQLPKAGTRVAAWRWLLWVVVWLAILLFQGPLRNGFGAGLWLGLPLSFLIGVLVWWWTQHLLLTARVPWLPLLPGALLAGAALCALSLTARLYIPGALNRALDDYGSLGLVLTLLSWLIAICAALAFAFTIGAVLAEGPPLNRWLPPVPRPPTGVRPAGVRPAAAAEPTLDHPGSHA